MEQQLVLRHGGDLFVLAGEAVRRVWVRQISTATNGAHRAKREATLAGLRLGRINRLSILPDAPETWGMIQKVAHLVTVVAQDVGPLPLREKRKSKSSSGRKLARDKRMGRARAERGASARPAAPARHTHAPAPVKPRAPRTAARGNAPQEADTILATKLDAARRELRARGASGDAIRTAGSALREAARAAPTTRALGGTAALSRLSRIDLEHDLLDLLLSQDQEVAWDAAREIARSFQGKDESLRLSRGDGSDEHVLEVVVEVLVAEGQRYFSLIRYEREPTQTGGMHIHGDFVVSRALDLKGDRKVTLTGGRVQPDKPMRLFVYADGGIRAEDVTADNTLSDESVMLAERFSLAIPGDRLTDPVHVSFVVPGILVDTVEIASHAHA